jgi:hypothetical protein
MELKTKLTNASASAFLDALDNETRRTDCQTLSKLMQEATGAEPKLWGTNIVGFGTSRIKYASGKEADWLQIAFAPRKPHVTLYLTGVKEQTELLEKLGKHTLSGGCLHIKKLADVDADVLKELIGRAVAATR